MVANIVNVGGTLTDKKLATWKVIMSKPSLDRFVTFDYLLPDNRRVKGIIDEINGYTFAHIEGVPIFYIEKINETTKQITSISPLIDLSLLENVIPPCDAPLKYICYTHIEHIHAPILVDSYYLVQCALYAIV